MYFTVMPDMQDDPFENGLKEILRPVEPGSELRDAPVHKLPQAGPATDSSAPRGAKIPRWLEMLVRVAAGAGVVYLLLQFGLRAAGR